MELEILYSGIQPHGFFQIKFITDGVQGVKYHLCPGQGVVGYTYDRVLKQMVVLH